MLKFIRTVDKSLEDFLVLDLKTLSDLADNVAQGEFSVDCPGTTNQIS